jgi:hypothetical protein
MALNLKGEHTAKAWLFRALLGPAQIIDGVFALATIGTVAPGLALRAARALSRSRLQHWQAQP